MKKVITLIIGVMYCLTALCQQTSLDGVVSITVPKDAEKLTQKKRQAIETSSTRYSAINLNDKGNFYKVNGVLMQLNAGTTLVKSDYLEQTKKGLDALYRLDGNLPPPNYSSKIVAFKNFRVLIIQYDDARQDLSYYRFFSVSDSNKSGLNGILEFKKSDKGKAETILNDLLQSIKFKQ